MKIISNILKGKETSRINISEELTTNYILLYTVHLWTLKGVFAFKKICFSDNRRSLVFEMIVQCNVRF